MNYNGWRKSLVRILDMSGINFNAADSEEDLEKLILTIFIQNPKLSKKKKSSFPSAGIGKLKKEIGIATLILKDVGTIWDELLGCEDEPAINAVFAICNFMHEKKL